MVLVFGLDFPLFELLLVFMVLLVAAIIFILIELKRLNEYLLMERSDLRRLEKDLGVLEVEEQRIGAEEEALGVVAKGVPSPTSAKRSVVKKTTKKIVVQKKKATKKKR